jgi:shikimate dehydrogenase
MTVDRYGVMGYPVSHSRSPVIHRLFAAQTGQDIQYELLQVSPEKLETAVRQFQRTGGKGLNITVPHKSEVTRLVDHLSERASTAGAVNTLTFKEGEIHGDNTDGFGLLRDLEINLDLSLAGANILVLGAGGATRGIVGPLLEMQPASLRIANRTLGKAELIAVNFSITV